MRQPSVPPSEPLPSRVSDGDGTLRGSESSPRAAERTSSRASFDVLDAQVDRPARLQTAVAILLVVVLVAVPLYMWRRPRAEAIPVSTAGTETALPSVTAAPSATPTEEKLTLGEPKVLSCHDPGPKKTPPEQCDHPAELEKAFGKAIEETATCVTHDAGGGTLIYVADITFKKKSVSVATPKEGRTLKSAKVAGACERAVRSRLSTFGFDAAKHEHARYRLSITATYPGPVKP